MPLILSQPQAESVYSAMCALNNVGNEQFRASFAGRPGRRSAGDSHIDIVGGESARCLGVAGAWPIRVTTGCDADVEDNYTERYADQAAFAASYGLNQG